MLRVGRTHTYVYSSHQQLAKRTAKRAKAEAELKVATEADDKNDIDRFSKRLVRVTRDHNEDCKKLLGLMGVPVVTVSYVPHVGFDGIFDCLPRDSAPYIVRISVQSCRSFTCFVGILAMPGVCSRRLLPRPRPSAPPSLARGLCTGPPPKIWTR